MAVLIVQRSGFFVRLPVDPPAVSLQTLNKPLTLGRIERHPAEHHAGVPDPVLDRELHNLVFARHIPAQPLENVGHALAPRLDVAGEPVMRQPDLAPIQGFGFQLGAVAVYGAVRILHILDHIQRAVPLLHQGDGHCVVPAKVHHDLNFPQGVIRHKCYLPVRLRPLNLLEVNCAFNRWPAFSFPYVVVVVGVALLAMPAFSVKNPREPWIVPVVHLYRDARLGRVDYESLICFVCLKVRVERGEDFRPFGPDCWD